MQRDSRIGLTWAAKSTFPGAAGAAGAVEGGAGRAGVGVVAGGAARSSMGKRADASTAPASSKGRRRDDGSDCGGGKVSGGCGVAGAVVGAVEGLVVGCVLGAVVGPS